MKLYSEEWINVFIEKLQKDEIFQKKAKKFNAVYQYVIKSIPEKGVESEYRFAVKYPEATEYWIGDHEKPDYIMTSPYSVMHDILTGKTNAIKALTTRKAFVSGNLPNLLRFTGAINRIVAIMQEVPAECEGEFEDVL